ncbi:MAG: tRNA (adenosine(37)-N6)-dimethylallyltransferase MiaA [Candidatus Cloacimonetes bacterium]|nr:tRNA (adenosine(37)-N6)-dimethylallyltransferase MiaA [Candidatus Cloacimonadota bacterium]
MIPIVIVEGPTASGKSALALELAQHLGSGIISADSRQIYRGMDIGTAKATAEEQTRIPHHLIDIVNPDCSYDAGSFARDAGKVIEDYHARGLVPVLCGGTGMYIKTLLEGICELPPIPAEIKEALRERLPSAEDAEARQAELDRMYQELQAVDAEFAGGISNMDTQRIIRGLEVYQATGIPLSEHWRRQSPQQLYKPFRILLNPPRAELYQRINQRMDKMVEAGLLEEIKGLLASSYTWDDPGLNSLGYKEYRGYLEGRQSLEDAVAMAAQGSRNYAKRQVTWYRKVDFDLTFTGFTFNLSVLYTRISEEFASAERKKEYRNDDNSQNCGI